jgi:hypothetical protein
LERGEVVVYIVVEVQSLLVRVEGHTGKVTVVGGWLFVVVC